MNWSGDLEDLLIVRNQLTGTHRQMQVVAQEARAFSRVSIELQGRVGECYRSLQLRTEHLIWQIKEQLIGDRPAN